MKDLEAHDAVDGRSNFAAAESQLERRSNDRTNVNPQLDARYLRAWTCVWSHTDTYARMAIVCLHLVIEFVFSMQHWLHWQDSCCDSRRQWLLPEA